MVFPPQSAPPQATSEKFPFVIRGSADLESELYIFMYLQSFLLLIKPSKGD